MGTIKRPSTYVEAGHAASEFNNDLAYRRFLGRSFFAEVDDAVASAMRHKITAGILLLMFGLGLVGLLATFWPGR